MTILPKNLLITGAGFSFNAGLPLASEFMRALLDVKGLSIDGPSNKLVKPIRAFVDKAFGEGQERSVDEWPEIEDVFTLLDLSANSGHHLGPDYSSSFLRVIRRALLIRMIRMLPLKYKRRQKRPDVNWYLLEQFFQRFSPNDTAILSMNWDTVIEQGLSRAQGLHEIDYGCSATPCQFQRNDLRFLKRAVGPVVRLTKPHGSINWLYCDACRETFWVPPSQSSKVAQTLFQERDWKALGYKSKERAKVLSPRCPKCAAEALGTRFATFSYRKALDFPMHSASWRTGENYLKNSSRWVFFGYSLPSADFEFKHLLKWVQLSEFIRPAITVVTGGSDAKSTIERYEKFFGKVSGERTYFINGLTTEVLDHFASVGVIKSHAHPLL